MTNRMAPNPEPEKTAESEKSHLRNLARWLLLVPIVLITLLCSAQLALFGISPPTAKDTGSNLEADYSIWPFSAIPRILPEIIGDIWKDRGGAPDEIIISGRVWPLLPFLPTDEPVPQNTATPVTPTNSATPELVQPTLTASIPPTLTPSPTSSLTPTYVWVWIPSNTPIPTSPPTSTDKPDPTIAPTPLPTATTAPSLTPSPTPVVLPTSTDTPPASDTPTPSLTPTDTPLASDTLTPSLTPTETPELCSGNIPPGEPDIGPSDGDFASIPCGGMLIIDLEALGYPAIDTTAPDSDYDIRYYEKLLNSDPTLVSFDWVTLQVGTGPTGSCGSGTWYTALAWGDGDPNNNGHLGASYPENDDELIPISDLHGSAIQTGISIDLDAGSLGIPNQEYPCILIFSPVSWPANDSAEVDAIQIFP